MNTSGSRIAPRTIYQVSELADLLRGLLEDSLPRLWVQGEVSNFVRPASGHWYFTLKDAGAQLRCVMFKGNNHLVRPQPRDGDSVLVRGTVGLYAARGDLQFVCEHLEPAGEGALLRAFEQLKARLAAEGLFDEKLKRPLPAVPRGIGVITSGTGAALQDILTTLARRFPLGRVWLYPVPVQGAEAPPAIIRALGELPRRAPVDVVILARGGGSLEDLWAFNDEGVARAIRACAVPVVSGVGHEIDFTIADLAADLRAATPTAAAERVSPSLAEWSQRLDSLESQLQGELHASLQDRAQRLDELAGRLQRLHPGRRLGEAAQRLDDSRQRLALAQQQLVRRNRLVIDNLAARLAAGSPDRVQALRRQSLDNLATRLAASLRTQQVQASLRLQQAQTLLQSLNPTAVLERGYAIALDAEGRALTDARQSSGGAALQVQLARGTLDVTVNRTQPIPS